MKTLQLDKNYQISVHKQDPYNDKLDKKLDLLLKAKKNGLINDNDLKILLAYFINKEARLIINSYFKSSFSSQLKENLLIFDYFKKEHLHE